MPVLGICGGQQLLAVALGGTLIQHIPDSIATSIEHEQPNPRTEPGHDVIIAPDTLLARIIGKPRMAVNSAHHQAVATPGQGAVINALAPDGVVEGVEHPGHRFALGVQWHPEYAVDPADPLIFAAFVQACR
jgi:putative glutamine amidotransferase